MYKHTILLLLLAGVLINSSAQNKNSLFFIRGIVIDNSNNDTLPGVTIILKNTNNGTISDAGGNYLLRLPSGEYTLVVSFIGYESQEIKIVLDHDQFFVTRLNPVIKYIDEIKITGQRKFFGNMEYGRDIPSINSKEIKKLNTSNASDILHANIAGVWATKTSGSPGDHEKIRIRGQASFFSSSEPLYVVDGVPVPIVNMSSLGIGDLNMDDIENVTVLRDASSTALYGFQGGNGVVLIDTKKGGENEISFTTKIGTQWFNNFYPLMGTKEFLETLQLADSTLLADIRRFYPPMSDTIKSDNWQDMVFNNALSKQYQLSLKGSAGKTKGFKYYFSGSYTDQDGILINQNYKRYTVTSHLGKTTKKLAVDFSYRGSVQDNTNNQDLYAGNQMLYYGLSNSPCLRSTPDSFIYFPDGRGPNMRILCPYDYFNIQYPLSSYLKRYHHKLLIKTHDVSASGRLQLNTHLSFNAMAALLLRNSKYDNTYNYYSYKSHEDVILVNHQYNISYFNAYGRNNIGLVAAYRYYTDNLWWKVDTSSGYPSGIAYLKNSMAAYANNGSVIRSIGSYVGNASYDYNKIFFLSLVSNISRIKEGLFIDYYSMFPSAAVSWDLARHLPLNYFTLINNFNLYVNWGRSGNYPLNGLGNDLYASISTTMGNVTTNNTRIQQLANHSLRHETTNETDYGFNGSFFNKRLTLNFALYNKSVSHLILQRPIPQYYGAGTQFVNVGEIEIKGKEFGIQATPVNTSKLLWTFNFNLSESEQTVTKMYDTVPISLYDMFGDRISPVFKIQKGSSIGDIYGYKILGRWTASDNTKDKRYVKRLGMKYLNGDSSNRSIDIRDKVLIGNSIPKITWNFSNTFQYKNISLDMVWYAVLGNKKFNMTRAATYITGVNREVRAYIEDSIKAVQAGDFYQSNMFLEDASFIRLKTVTLTFAPEKNIWKKINYRVSLSLENFITITKYKGYDPEATTYTDNNFSDNAFDRGNVPNPKAFYVTISLLY